MFVLTGRDCGRDFSERITQEKFAVHSVFKTVCNLQSDPDKPLLAFVTRASARAPNTLWLPEADFSSLRVGEEVNWEGKKLCCGGVEIDFGYCEALWSCDLQQVGVVDYSSGATSDIATPRDIVIETDLETDSDTTFDTAFSHFPNNVSVTVEAVEGWSELQFPGLCTNYSEQVCQLCDGLKTLDLLKTRTSLFNLIGSGEGLTPSGDDFVAGVLLGYVRSRKNCEDQRLNTLSDMIRNLAGQTNEISNTMLWYAARGEGAEYLTRTADQILSAGPYALQYALELTKVGSSSGKYLLAGLLRGIKMSHQGRF